MLELELRVTRWTGEQHRWSARFTRMALALIEVFEDAGDDLGLGHLANDTELPAALGTG